MMGSGLYEYEKNRAVLSLSVIFSSDSKYISAGIPIGRCDFNMNCNEGSVLLYKLSEEQRRDRNQTPNMYHRESHIRYKTCMLH